MNTHIIAAAMQYFGMKCVDDTPSFNSFPLNVDVKQQWKSLKQAVSGIVERYIIVQDFTEKPKTSKDSQTVLTNPHVDRIRMEHSYSVPICTEVQSKRRVLPDSIRSCKDYTHPSQDIKKISPDKVLEYDCAVLSDGLLLLEFRDAIHEGDSERVIRCWRLMLLYFFHSGHRKYALEALTLQAASYQRYC